MFKSFFNFKSANIILKIKNHFLSFLIQKKYVSGDFLIFLQFMFKRPNQIIA